LNPQERERKMVACREKEKIGGPRKRTQTQKERARHCTIEKLGKKTKKPMGQEGRSQGRRNLND